MITISRATIDDIQTIQSIAGETWQIVYKKIITQEQIEYMLDLFYSESALLDAISRNHIFLLIKDNELSLGFASYEHNYPQKKLTRLHKLYLTPNAHGKGFGKLLMNEVKKSAIENQSIGISLNVNKYNKAVQFYLKSGYEIVKEEKIAIGHDFFMDDYVMELQLT